MIYLFEEGEINSFSCLAWLTNIRFESSVALDICGTELIGQLSVTNDNEKL
jgi:hypothetical protein